jgi:dephospho-CoA kinase
MTTPAPHAPFIVALTGGIASGKTTVANLFEALGVTVIDTDQLARDVVEPGTPALAQIVAAFGPEILDARGRLDRRRMRERVFANPEDRRRLEAITHPAIRAELARRSQAAQGPYQMHVIPLLAEGGRRDAFDRVLVVDCPTDVQVARLLKRDGASPQQAQQILAAQATREQRLAIADDVIRNEGDPDALKPQVAQLHRRYLALAAAKAASSEAQHSR